MTEPAIQLVPVFAQGAFGSLIFMTSAPVRSHVCSRYPVRNA